MPRARSGLPPRRPAAPPAAGASLARTERKQELVASADALDFVVAVQQDLVASVPGIDFVMSVEQEFVMAVDGPSEAREINPAILARQLLGQVASNELQTHCKTRSPARTMSQPLPEYVPKPSPPGQPCRRPPCTALNMEVHDSG
mmetsp:Transcript_15234/g.38612  ORF Transcript_15234/g.38612 Transcript_15234/m.38612 type:complete len:145 (-) Transcript_15234:180-614(-)